MSLHEVWKAEMAEKASLQSLLTNAALTQTFEMRVSILY